MYRILYVDDEPELLEIGRLFLQQGGDFSVDTVTSAIEALDSLPLRTYDAIVSDYLMPGMDGIAFLKAVRERYGSIPFILFTGRGREEVVIAAINAGADFYLQKGGAPVAQFAELAQKIRQAVTRRRAEDALNESERRFRELADLLPQGIYEATPDGRLTYANRRALEMFGYTEDDIRQGMNILSTISPQDQQRVAGSFRKIAEEGIPLPERTEYRALRKDGSTFPIAVFSSSVLRNGQTAGLRGILMDITEQQQAAEALYDSEERLRSFIETTRDAVVLVDENGSIIEWNPAAEEISTMRREDVLHKPLLDIQMALLPVKKRTAEQREELEHRIRTMFRTGLPAYSGPQVFEAERPDGTRVILRQTIVSIKTGRGFRFGLIAQDITEEQRALKAISESEQMFRGIAERSWDLILVVNREMSVTYATPSSMRILGYEPQELVGMTRDFAAAKIFAPSLAEFNAPVKTAMNGTPMEKAPLKITKKDGSTAWVEIHAVPVLRDGVFDGAQIIIRDITEKKEAEIALQESQNQFETLFRSSPVPLTLVSADDATLVKVNDKFLERTGYTEEEVLGKTAEDLRLFADPSDYVRIVDQIRLGQHLKGIEMKFRVRSGEIRTCLYSSSIVQLKGRPYVLSNIDDITWRRETEEALRKSEEKFRSFVENANEIIFSLDPGGIFTYVSPNWTELLGHNTRDVIGRSAKEFIHPDDLPRNLEVFIQAVSTGRKTSGLEYRIRHLNGTWQWHSQSITPVFDASGRISEIQGICHDITRRKTAQEALRMANRQLTLLTNITRHDIINKVSVILGYLAIIKMNPGSPEIPAVLDRVESATTAIRSQIEFTRIYQDLGTRDPQWIELDGVIPRGQVPPGISLETDVRGIFLHTDPMLERVFFNLLDNSLRHGERVTRIRVTSIKDGDQLVIVWEDNGVGIPADEKEKIFERGFGKNTGLGMFLVREILMLTGITIRETGEQGRGARFEILVPPGSFRA